MRSAKCSHLKRIVLRSDEGGKPVPRHCCVDVNSERSQSLRLLVDTLSLVRKRNPEVCLDCFVPYLRSRVRICVSDTVGNMALILATESSATWFVNDVSWILAAAEWPMACEPMMGAVCARSGVGLGRPFARSCAETQLNFNTLAIRPRDSAHYTVIF